MRATALILFVLPFFLGSIGHCDAAEQSKKAHRKGAQKTKEAALTTKPSARPVFEPDGRFGFCLADHAYKDGRKISIALSPQDQMNIGFTLPGGRFEVGARYDLALALGEAAARKIRAQAIDADTVLLQMGTNAPFQKKLRASRKLTVGSPSKTVAFDLPDMGNALDSLRSCVRENKDKKDASAARIEAALPETLKALLVTAGFMDIVPMDMKGVPPDERPADFIWRTGHVLGGVRERKAPEGKSLSDLIGLYVNGLKSQCRHAFRATISREEKKGALILQPAVVSCTPKKKSEGEALTVALLFYLTPKGGFTVFTHEAQGAKGSEAIAASDRLAKTLADLAQRQGP